MAGKTKIGGTNYTISGGKTRVSGTVYSIKGGKTRVNGTIYNVSFGPKPEANTLEECSWENIAAISEAGLAQEFWRVGDTKNITAGSETLTLEILGFDHDDLTSGGKAGITFGMKELMSEQRVMRYDNTNSGGFVETDLYEWLNGELMNSLETDLKNSIKTVNKKTSTGGYQSVATNSMKIFLLAPIELFGVDGYATAGEGTQYERYKGSTTQIKKLSNGSGEVVGWWNRSPRKDLLNDFCSVNTVGEYSSIASFYSRGVCFCFCV